MKHNSTPILDPRDAAQVLDELLSRRPAYLPPDWEPVESQASWALLQIFARYMQTVINRLNQAPDKNLLAFLDMLGVSLIPAQAARAPVVFQMLPNGLNGSAPAGTRLGATTNDRSGGPIMFETEGAIGLAAARLTEVMSLWPARDAYVDHTSTVAGGQPFTLFKPLQPAPHEFYLAHDTLFAFAGQATVEIEFELSTLGSDPLTIVWEYWDGQVWRPFKAFDPTDETASQDGTAGLTRSGVVTLRVECGRSEKTTLNGLEAYWVRGRLDQPLPPDPAQVLAVVDRVRVRMTITKPFAAGLQPDLAFADGIELDLSKSFYPFGQQPRPGSTFYFSSSEAFSKPGAQISISAHDAKTPQEETDDGADATPPSPSLIAEYWNGRRWASLLNLEGGDLETFIKLGGDRIFDLPTDISVTKVNGEEGLWLRIRIIEGSFIRTRTIRWGVDGENTIVIAENVPPALCDLLLRYDYRSPWERPEQCLAYNDFQFELHSHDVRWPGEFFPPFQPVTDTTPALYLGFDRPLPNDLISLYLAIEESEMSTPPLVWEAWDGTTWRELAVTDETAGLRRPGMVSFIAPEVKPRPQVTIKQANGLEIIASDALEAAVFQPGDQVVIRQDDKSELATVQQVKDALITLATPLSETYMGGTVTLAGLPRFGTSLDWIRARLKAAGAPAKSRMNGIHPNATWARQVQTIENEVLGSGTDQPNQTLFFSQVPVLPGEQIEVRELEGARAEVELPILRDELSKRGLGEDDTRPVFDPRTGRVKEVWVRWQPRPHLFFSGPDDRHYMVERARGRLIFGDGQYGRLPSVGTNNIRARRYQAGGGLAGNVAAGAISQMLSGVLAQGVTNPTAAEGGAEGELPVAVKTRGPQTPRHRGRSLAARDYEALAKEASPAVAAVRALPATAPNGRPAPGWVTVMIVPQSQEPQPQPSYELRRQVHDYLVTRAPATVASHRIAVIGPTYLPIGVASVIAPGDPGEASLVERRVRTALETFLHPLAGGPEGRGWPFGRNVYLSDVAAVVEAVSGVDYAEKLDLLLGDAPVGERVAVPAGRIVVAGTIRIEMKRAER